MRKAIQRRRAARRARHRKRTARRNRRRARRNNALTALTSGALALSGVAGTASSDTPAERIVSNHAYTYYSEDELPASKVAPGSVRSRYEIHGYQSRLSAPIADRFDLGVDVMRETMSGATPWYVVPDANGDPVQVMSGATVEDARTDALVMGSYYLDYGRLGASAGISTENDYFAWNGAFEGERHFNEKNTTLSSGLGFSIDTIEPTDGGTDGRPVKEDKQSFSLFGGVSQLLGRGASLQSTLNYQHSTGFLSDPYKKVLVVATPVPDNRPDARNQFSWLTRYRQHFSTTDSTLHADYRFYVDDWNINSHTLELAWYQSIWDAFRLIPSFRYYSQSQADFYAPFFAATPADNLASSDYRLSPYGALSWRLRAETVFSTWRIDWLASFTWERYLSSGDYALGPVNVANPGLVSFNRISVGLTARF